MHVVPLYIENISFTKFVCGIVTHRSKSRSYLLFIGNVTREEGDIVIPLHDIKHGHVVPTLEQLFDDMSPEKTTATNY
jgi:hypothetical protein